MSTFIIAGDKKAPTAVGSQISSIMNAFKAMTVGKVIASVGYEKTEDGEYFPVLLLNDGTVLTVARDDEFNGPGIVTAAKGDAESRLCEVR